MTGVQPIPAPALEGTRLAFLLAEDRVGHYPEFRDFLAATFDLDRIGLATPGYLRAPSGGAYALVFIGRSGEPFPSGVEIFAIVPALEPLDEDVVDRDLWAILRWLVEGTGGAWSVADLDATGRLYRIAAAGSSA
jgi:hypothetical protein